MNRLPSAAVPAHVPWWRTEIPLGTRVARRLMVLFALAMLLPLGGALHLVRERVEDALLELHAARLDEAAGHHAAALQARLDLAGQLARALTPRFGAALTQDNAGTYFRRIGSIQRDGSLLMLRGAAPARGQESKLPTERDPQGTLAVLNDPDGTPRVWLVRPPVDPASPARHVIIEVNPAWLWSGGIAAGTGVDICVLGAGDTLLHCTQPLSAPTRAKVALMRVRQPAGRVFWESSEGRNVSAWRPMPSDPRRPAAGWTVIATQSESAALAPVATLVQLVVPALLVAVLVAALLGSLQVNRTLRPLDALTRATRRLARRDFDAQVALQGRDEFTELGRAFNGMSAQLQRQFRTMEALAGIDRLILSDPDTSALAAFTLDRLAVAVDADLHAVALADDAADAHFALHWRSAWRSDCVPLAREVTLEHGATGLGDAGLGDAPLCKTGVAGASAPGATSLEADTARARGLEGLAQAGAARIVVQPVVVGGTLEGLVALGYLDPSREADADDRKLLQDLADRLAVATASARRDRELRHRALYDPLTGLANRTHFLDQLDADIARAGRDGSHRIAVLFIDLDGFARVNDSHGHAAGDRLLGQAGARLREAIEPQALLARMGGDEFVVALPGVARSEDAQTAAMRIVATLSDPFDVDGTLHYLAASVGIALFPEHGTDAAELLRGADLAMYRAKERGRGLCLVFEPAMTVDIQKRTRVEAELRRALDESQFVLHYQPLVAPDSGRVAGAEALIRWQHPERGMVPPVEFIGIAEQTGLIDEMGEWVMREACRQWVAWRRAGVLIDSVSVNVSVGQFRRTDFIDRVFAALREVGMPPSALKLEVTESVMMDDSGGAELALEELSRLGVKLALDDFGTGYSSLAYLRKLPVDTVKLDRSFVRDLGTDPASRELVRAAIAMAHALRKSVTAEGVETEDQVRWLHGWQCDLLQGWFYGKAMPAEDFARFVTERERSLRGHPA